MVRIFRDAKGNFMVQTTCLDTGTLIAELSEAITEMNGEAKDDGGLALMGILTQAMPIAFKLSGYKADTVTEQRTLVCGFITPSESELVATAGK